MIALLRGINVSGKNRILMSELKILFEELGFKNVTTYIQSGNVVFNQSGINNIIQLEKTIEDAIHQKFGYVVPVILRTNEEWKKVIDSNPYKQEAEQSPERHYITYLKDVASKDNLSKFRKSDYSPDKFNISEKEIYVMYATKYSASKLNNNLIESKLKIKASTRNWKTTLKLREMMDAIQD